MATDRRNSQPGKRAGAGLDRLFEGIAKGIYLFAALALVVLAVSTIVAAVWLVGAQVLSGESSINTALNSIGLIILSVAVVNVAKFILEEEILRERELRSPREVRLSLTKFMTIIIVATSLEALVIVFETKEGNVRELIYPTFLMAVGVLALVGLGLFQWLSRHAGSIEQATQADEDEAEAQS
ncbi:MAG: hypothetical protein H0W33_01320 [Gammaproteobacteria bacterium]|nr:hypothetical protein [Gammaproteobacteria bacterium]